MILLKHFVYEKEEEENETETEEYCPERNEQKTNVVFHFIDSYVCLKTFILYVLKLTKLRFLFCFLGLSL
jgi:hypothetical protein